MPRKVRAAGILILFVLSAVVAVAAIFIDAPIVRSPSDPIALADPSFSFGASADFAFSSTAQSVMTSMGQNGLDFGLVVGDFSYGATSEQNWCNFFESQVGDGRVLLISGNHDTGSIDTFRQYCNYGIPATINGDYAKQYYFDYPQTAPIARFILLSCAVLYGCNSGDAAYTFASDALSGARAAGIPWVIVGTHKVCISSGPYDCEVSEAMQDLYIPGADLVLQAHEHTYQRSKQLSCADNNVYRPECVVDSDGAYEKGKGTVVNIMGTGGNGLYGIQTNADRNYFAAVHGSGMNGDSYGFTKFTLNATALQGTFIKTGGTFSDSYTISTSEAPPPPPPPPTPDFSLAANPSGVSFQPGGSAVSTSSLVNFNGFAGSVALTAASSQAGVSANCVPSSISGSQTSTCTFSSSTIGSYTVTITGTSGSLVHTVPVSVTVTSTPPPPPPGQTTSLTLTTSPNPSQAETSVRVSGKLANATSGEGLPGQTVALEWSWDNVTWQSESQIGQFAPTDSNGVFVAFMIFHGVVDHTEYLRASYVDSRSPVDPQWIQLAPVPSPAPPPECSDGKDNDGDAKVDFPADPGCADYVDNDETGAAPPPLLQGIPLYMPAISLILLLTSFALIRRHRRLGKAIARRRSPRAEHDEAPKDD